MKMKFTAFHTRSLWRLTILLFLLTFATHCRNDLDVSPKSDAYLVPTTVKDQLSTKMAKILAQKMADQATREFIKQNVLKRFDEDYNFLFVDSYRFLLDKGRDASFIDSVIRYHPLMQIVVPELSTVAPEDWNTTSHVPLVAVVPELHRPGKDTIIGAYDTRGNLHKLSTIKDPKQHIVVISENVRTQFYLAGTEPTIEKIRKAKNGRACDIFLRVPSPNYVTTSKAGSYYLKKEVARLYNLVEEGCDGGGGGGGYYGGGPPPNNTSSCQRETMSPDRKDIIGDMSYQNMSVLRSVADWTGSAKDFKMDIDYGGINGSPVKNFAVYFWVSRHTSSSCDFFWWCWATQFNPNVPTLSWDRTNDGNQMKYTLWALGNGATTTNTQTYTATGEGGLSLSYTVTKSVSSKDQILGQDYVKYCDVANGQGTRYAVGQYAYFYIHR